MYKYLVRRYSDRVRESQNFEVAEIVGHTQRIENDFGVKHTYIPVKFMDGTEKLIEPVDIDFRSKSK